MTSSFKKVEKVQVMLSNGKPYTMMVTRNPEEGSKAPDKKAMAQAKAAGREYLFNVKRNCWQSVMVTKIFDAESGEMVDFTKRAYPKRMSLHEAIDVLAGYGMVVSKSDSGYVVERSGSDELESYDNGFALVRFAKELVGC